MHLRPHETLIVWKEAHGLCLSVYQITKQFPPDERFGLTSQMRRAGYGIPMNIAEGNAKRSPKEKARYYEIALGSIEELHYQFTLACDLGYIDRSVFREIDDRINRIGFLLTKLRQAFL